MTGPGNAGPAPRPRTVFALLNWGPISLVQCSPELSKNSEK